MFGALVLGVVELVEFAVASEEETLVSERPSWALPIGGRVSLSGWDEGSLERSLATKGG